MTPDLINGLIQLAGAGFTWRNYLQLHRERALAGVYWPATAFFSLWGVWNLYYFPALGQWISLAGSVVLVAGNMAWTMLAIHLKIEEEINACLNFSQWDTAQAAPDFWLYEIAELEALSQSDAMQAKTFLTSQPGAFKSS